MRTETRLYVNSDWSRVVDESDPEAAFLLAPAGGVIEDAQARKLGLLPATGVPEEKMVSGPPEDKAVSGPPEATRTWPRGGGGKRA